MLQGYTDTDYIHWHDNTINSYKNDLNKLIKALLIINYTVSQNPKTDWENKFNNAVTAGSMDLHSNMKNGGYVFSEAPATLNSPPTATANKILGNLKSYIM